MLLRPSYLRRIPWEVRCAGAGPHPDLWNRGQPRGFPEWLRYIKSRYLKAVRSCTEVDWQDFGNHRRVKGLVMISC